MLIRISTHIVILFVIVIAVVGNVSTQTLNVAIECIEFSGEEFIQIRNYTSTPQNISDWVVKDISDGNPSFTFPSDTVLPENGIVRIYTQEVPDGSPAGTFTFERSRSIWSDSDPDEGGLFNAEGIMLSSKSYPPSCKEITKSIDDNQINKDTTQYDISIECINFKGIRLDEPDEYVQIRNNHSEEVQLTDWILKDISDGSPEFVFPQYTLPAGERVRVYTNQVHPYWGGFTFSESRSIWSNSSGAEDIAGLFAPDGNLVTSLSYPPDCIQISKENKLLRADIALEGVTAEVGKLEIVCISYTGEEYVTIQNTDTKPLDLYGWRLQDIADGTPTFVFPEYSLQPQEALQVYTSRSDNAQFSFGYTSSIWADNSPYDQAGLFSPYDIETPVSTKTYPPGCEEPTDDDDQTTPSQEVFIEKGDIEIVCVDRIQEAVVIQNTLTDPLSIDGVQLIEVQTGISNPASYTFPEGTTISNEGNIIIYSASSQGNTYAFGRTYIWNNDGSDYALLQNPNGTEIDSSRTSENCLDAYIPTQPTQPSVDIAWNPAQIVEGANPSNALLTVSISEDILQPTLLTIILSGTAEFSKDYTVSGFTTSLLTLSSVSGWSSRKTYVSVTILDDTIQEGKELLYASVGQPIPSGVTLNNTTATLTILDNDTQQLIEIACTNRIDEFVILRNKGSEPVSLEGWTLHERQAGKRNPAIYTFPSGSVISGGGTLRVYSAMNEENTEYEHFFGRSNIWNNSGGDTTVLTDPNGNQVSEVTPVNECQ